MNQWQNLEMLGAAHKPRIGLYTSGLQAYWPQFEGLRERLIAYGQFMEQRMSGLGAEVHNFGLVDSDSVGRKAGEWFQSRNVDLIFCHCGSYFSSDAVLPLHQICRKPVVILNLQPTAAMNYEQTNTGEWLAHCVACPVPELANAFHRANINFEIVNGLLGLDQTPEISLTDEVTAHRKEAVRAWSEIEQWIQAACVQRTLQRSRFGFLGHNFRGMLDLYSDFTMMQGQAGIHVEVLEMCNLKHFLDNVGPEEIQNKIQLMEEFFEISGDSPSDPIARKPTKEQMEWSARVAAAQEKMVRHYRLDALVYYYMGTDDNEYEKIQGGFIVGHSLLTGQGIPCAGEGDLKTGLAMKICDILNIGGSYSEIVAMDYNRDTIILGHDGPFHIKIAAKKPVLRGMGVYHGKQGSGVSVEANVLEGAITTLNVTQTREGKLKMIVSEGEAIAAPILKIGNTQTHISFSEQPDRYMDRWFAEAPTHHCALSTGHNAALFKKVSRLLDIDLVSLQ